MRGAKWSAEQANRLAEFQGRRLLGAVDGIGCVELVFEDSGGANLVSIFPDKRLAIGFVDAAVEYAEQHGIRT